MQNNDNQWHDWIGKSESSAATITSFPMEALAATLDKPVASYSTGASLPPLWHWLYFLETSPQSQLAADGHAKRGNFLPPVLLPRRMWAGSRVEFLDKLHVGDTATRVSTIKSITSKQGRSGALVFVALSHEISTTRGIAIQELQDIVYREAAKTDFSNSPTQPAPASSGYSKTINPDSTFLFRYSALTFNGHRIHYDREFARDQEGYPGLVVHGPLLATLMIDLLLDTHPTCSIKTFEFRAILPLFDLHPFTVCGDEPDADGNVKLWVQNHAGALCMQSSARIMEN